jgi:(1->4)-alpha-D-glucan 1-alpha-D-glucosylmutase
MERSIFDFVRGCLLAEGNGIPARELAERRDFAMRFQQYATAVQAKGVEDTAFYRHHALTSLCEVGGEPARFGGSVGEFHAANRRRRERWPHGMLATATHDTKRGEDARARIDVISEMPLDWGRAVTRWARMHTGLRSEPGESAAPDRNDEWLLYQTLVGVWPPEGASAAEDELVERIGAYLLKAAREAKLNTSWINPNERYEAALRGFVEGALRGRSSARFLESLGETAADVARCGALNSLAALVLKLVSPGVADTYQGCELWDLSLVDPDNRRPIDFSRRARLLDELDRAAPDTEVPASFLAELLASWPDGRLKLFVLARGLRLRRERPEMFLEGESLGLEPTGEHAGHIVAAARRRGDAFALAIVPRLTRSLATGDRPFPLGDVWGDTRVPVPRELGELRDAFTGERVRIADGSLALSHVLRRWPVTLLVSLAS